MKQSFADSAFVLRAKRLTALTQAAILALAVTLPLLAVNQASAAIISNREVTISTSEASASAEYVFEFDFAAQVVNGIIFEFCDDPLPQNTCNLPAGMNVQRTNVSISGDTGFQSGVDSFSEFGTDDTNDCDDIDDSADDTMFCVTGTNASASGTDATVTLDGITNPNSETTVYIRIQLYSDATFTTAGDNGTVAAAIVAQLTVNGRVQERLEFCVAAVDDADDLVGTTFSSGGIADCIALTDTNVDIGIVDESSIAISPVNTSATNGADDDYGILMVNTNAQGGVILSYFAEDPSSVSGGDTDQLKSFRVVPADCNASAATLNDQCFQSAANAGTGSVLTQGVELFGMYIPCVQQNDGTLSTTANLTTSNDNYNGSDDTITTSVDCENEAFVSATGVLGWNSGTTADTLISSSTVVDDEIVKLRFAATASPTTPPGSYTVTTTYVATATF